MVNRPRTLVLCILDGFGEREEDTANAIRLAKTPNLDALRASCPTTSLHASGGAVGLPKGQMGNSEIGHLTLGAGRVLLSNISKIDQAVDNNKLGINDMVDQTMRIGMYHEKPLHLFGLLSDGGVHSSIEHLFALIDIADFHEIPVLVHAFLDGRDTPPRSALNYLDKLTMHLEGKNGQIATLSGRYYAMDRDERWDRVYRAFHAIVRDKMLGSEAPRAATPFDAISDAYARGITDEFVEPVRLGDYQGIGGEFMADFAATTPVWEWTGEEPGFAFNFRGDRMRQLAAMLTRQMLPDYVATDLLMDRDRPVLAFQEHYFAAMTSYADDLKIPVAFPKQSLSHTVGEILSEAKLTQLRCAETEKAPHVTYFFSGGREEPFDGEVRKITPSPRLVDTYDEKPEMSAAKVTSTVVEALKNNEFDFICVNFANPDMVGHTGQLDAAISAVQSVDQAIGKIADAVRRSGSALLITADHGNCELMVDAQGVPHTAHTTLPVPLVYLNEADAKVRLAEDGSLADVAPTMLQILGLEQPQAMTGKTLRIEVG